MTLLRLLGIGALAALAALFWATAGTSAQSNEPTVTVAHGGWAADDANTLSDAAKAQIKTGLTIGGVADGSAPLGLDSTQRWTCPNLKCHYLNVSWSGIPQIQTDDPSKPGGYEIIVARRSNTTAKHVGMSDAAFAVTAVPVTMSLRAPGSSTQAYVAVPWPGERLTVAVQGEEEVRAHAIVRTPAPTLPAAFTSARSQSSVGATLVENPVDGNLPTVLAIWREVDGATYYEVEYTFRSGSDVRAQRLTRVTRTVARSQVADKENIHEGETHYAYEALDADWDQHPNAAVLNALNNYAFGDVGQPTHGKWMGALSTLGKLLLGAEGWPQTEVAADNAVTDALSVSRNALGVRLRPVLACAVDGGSRLCSDNSTTAAPRAWRGKTSRISYATFEGADVDAWLTSIGRPPSAAADLG